MACGGISVWVGIYAPKNAPFSFGMHPDCIRLRNTINITQSPGTQGEYGVGELWSGRELAEEMTATLEGQCEVISNGYKV
jgi:hypothetical protein